MMHLRYLRMILAHKWHVLRFCVRLGIPWRGLTHDLSRFRPDEWMAHARFFCGGLSDAEREAMRPELDRAYALHMSRNDHHWQFWTYTFASTAAWVRYRLGIELNFIESDELHKLRSRDMPEPAVREMLADWRARALYRDGLPLRKWIAQHESKIALHPDTWRIVKRLLPIVEEMR